MVTIQQLKKYLNVIKDMEVTLKGNTQMGVLLFTLRKELTCLTEDTSNLNFLYTSQWALKKQHKDAQFRNDRKLASATAKLLKAQAEIISTKIKEIKRDKVLKKKQHQQRKAK